MRSEVEKILETQIPAGLVSGMLDAYYELKENFYLGRHRPSELEGGRFCEVAIRCCQHLADGTHTPLSKRLDRFDNLVRAMENAGGGQAHDSVRIHIPRALFAIYGIRNRRDVGHVGGDVNPNLADATLVMTVCDWVLTEFIRLIHACPLEDAQALVDGLVERKVPLIQEFEGFLKVLNPKLSVPDKIVALLYARQGQSATRQELNTWLKGAKPANVRVALSWLENTKAYIHKANGKCWITRAGITYAEQHIEFAL